MLCNDNPVAEVRDGHSSAAASATACGARAFEHVGADLCGLFLAPLTIVRRNLPTPHKLLEADDERLCGYVCRKMQQSEIPDGKPAAVVALRALMMICSD